MVTSPPVSWLFFKARAKRPYVSHTGRASNAEKQPTGRGPEDCIDPLPAAHFEPWSVTRRCVARSLDRFHVPGQCLNRFTLERRNATLYLNHDLVYVPLELMLAPDKIQ